LGGTALEALDIGTGSGAIAVSLSRLILGARVTALDVSPAALELARANAVRAGTEVRFVEADILELATGAVAGSCGWRFTSGRRQELWRCWTALKMWKL
jgi:methylase of polypeptide subunit release factors